MDAGRLRLRVLLLSKIAEIRIKLSTFMINGTEETLIWNGVDIGIDLRPDISPRISEKSSDSTSFEITEVF